MEFFFPLFARLLNETGHSLDFSVEEGRCPIPSLSPGRKRLVNLSNIHKCCSGRESINWLIMVSINKNLTEMTLTPENFLKHAQILFKLEQNKNGKFIFIADGIKDEDIGMVRRLWWNIGFVFGKKDTCSGRKYSRIADVLLEFPMNMRQTRQKDRKAREAPKFQQREAKGSLKNSSLAISMCSNVAVVPEAIVISDKRSPLREKDGKVGKGPKSQQGEAKDSLKKSDVIVVPEAIVNSNKRTPPLRKEERSQIEVDDSVKHMKVNSPKRENVKAGKAPKSQRREESKDSLKKSDVALVSDAIVNSYKRLPLRFSDKMNIVEEESPRTEIDNSVKHIKVNPSKRKRTAYTPLDGSSDDTFETKMSNSSQMEPLHRERNSPDLCHCHCHCQQQLTEDLENVHDHPGHSLHVPDKDITDCIFMLLFAIIASFYIMCCY